MALQLKRERRGDSDWPLAITLVLCALFACAIALKAKSEFDSRVKNYYQDLGNKAELVGNKVDFIIVSTNAKLAEFRSSAINMASAAALLPNIASVAAFDENGQKVEMGTATIGASNPLYAASQLAVEDGWFGALATGPNRFDAAISISANDGGTIAAIMKFNNELELGGEKLIILTDKNGAIIYKSPKLDLSGSNINIALGAPLDNIAISGGQIIKASNSNKYLISTAAAKSGFISYVLMPASVLNSSLFKLGLFYALLGMGPLLAFLGVWSITKAQTHKTKQYSRMAALAEKRLRIALEGAKCGVWDWDIIADNAYLTRRLANSFGLEEAGRYETLDILEGIVQKDRDRLRGALNASIQSGVLDIIVRVIPSATNKTKVSHIHLRGRAAGEKTKENKIHIIGVSIDVSEQVLTEQKVAAAELRLRDAINSAPGPIAIWNRNSELVLWNESFENVFGIEKTILKQGAQYKLVSGHAARNIISQRSDRSDNQAQEIELKNGNWVRLIERRTSDGGLVSVGIDITPQKQTEEEALKSEKRLRSVVTQLQSSEREAAELAKQYREAKTIAEAASASKDSFLANMSHELRTPLNAINGFSQMMTQEIYGPMGDPRYKEYANDILISGKHLLDLINDVLDMAKIEAGKFKLYPSPMSLIDTAETAISVVRGKAQENNISLEKDFGEIDEIIGDERSIKQILINLLSNAVKFTKRGGKILIRFSGDDAFVKISVIDTGIGISEANLSRLGRPFEQVENEHARTRQGTGLGLALCRSFAQMHGGQLSISSKLDVGTKVDVILPRIAKAQQAA